MRLFLLIFILHSMLFAQVFVEQTRISENKKPFNNPQAVSVSVDGFIYLVDSGNNCIHLLDRRGNFIRTFGGFGFEADQFDNPTDIWTKSLINIYVSDYNNRRVQRYDRSMNFISSLINNEALDSEFQFEEIQSCALNSNNDLFVLDRGENKIIKFNRRGEPERSFGYYESGEGELSEPVQLDILQNKYLLVSDPGNKAILVYDFFGNFIKKVTSPGFMRPAGLCVMDDESVILSDPEAKKVFVVRENLTKIEELELKILNPLRQPVDVAALVSGKQIRLFLIDADQLIIGNLLPD